MLISILEWLDLHPGSYWAITGAASLLLVAWLVALIARAARDPAAAPTKAGWPDTLVLFLFLLAWRWPFLFVARELNPDESQLIAGAMKLGHDPVFWRAVDGGSSGPLNYYFLLPWHWFGVPLGYFTARLTGLLLIWGALCVCLRTLSGAFGRPAAWLGLLPAVGFFATVTHPELIHYSTEHLPLFLIAVAFGQLAGRAPTDRLRLGLACFVAGALPWTKLQTIPIAFAFLGWAGWQVLHEPKATTRHRWRQMAGALLATALPTLLLAIMVTTTGETDTAVRRYFLQNIMYVGKGTPFNEAMGALWRNAQIDGRFPLLLGTVCVGLFAAFTYYTKHRVRSTAHLVAGVVITLAAAAAVVIPRREYLHYVLLLPVPLTICLGTALGGWWHHLAATRARLVLAGVLIAGGLLPLVTRALHPAPDIYGQFAYQWRHPRSSAAAVINALTGREDTLGLWGWASHLYMESGLPQATRDTNTLWSIEPSAQQAYHRAVYLDDLKKSAPTVFVDAVGQGAFRFDYRAVQAHEIFPELADYIRQNYTLVVDLLDARVYARNGLATHRDLSPSRLWQLVGRGRQPERFSLSPPSSSLDMLQHKIVGQRRVVMLLPPTRVEWQLDDEVREVSLEFGYDPVAYEQGQSNGTEIILEIAGPESTRPVYRRFLDPARQPGDRGPQTARVSLPSFAPGSTLILRTDPGQFGDNAWDWVYLASLKLHRPTGLPPP